MDGREHCICEIMDAQKLTKVRVLRHMEKLKAAGLVADRSGERWSFYRLSPDLHPQVRTIVETVLALKLPIKKKTAANGNTKTNC
jgi:ArsR family transcriptional regulator